MVSGACVKEFSSLFNMPLRDVLCISVFFEIIFCVVFLHHHIGLRTLIRRDIVLDLMEIEIQINDNNYPTAIMTTCE